MRPLVCLVLCALATPAFARDYHVDVPTGWVEQPETLLGPELTKLRQMKGTRSVQASLYRSPNEATQLTVMRWEMDLPSVTRLALLQLDAGMAKGTANVADRHISDTREFEGNRMRGTAVDEKGEFVIDQSRVFQVDAQRVVHMLNVTCAGPKGSAEWPACKAAQASMNLKVASAIDIPPSDDDKSLAYRLGQLTGFLLVIGTLAFVSRWISRRGTH